MDHHLPVSKKTRSDPGAGYPANYCLTLCHSGFHLSLTLNTNMLYRLLLFFFLSQIKSEMRKESLDPSGFFWARDGCQKYLFSYWCRQKRQEKSMTSLRRRQSISTKSIKIYIQMRNHVPLLGSQETSIRINDRRRKEIKRIRAQGSCKNVSNPVYTIYGLYIGRERERERNTYRSFPWPERHFGIGSGLIGSVGSCLRCDSHRYWLLQLPGLDPSTHPSAALLSDPFFFVLLHVQVKKTKTNW